MGAGKSTAARAPRGARHGARRRRRGDRGARSGSRSTGSSPRTARRRSARSRSESRSSCSTSRDRCVLALGGGAVGSRARRGPRWPSICVVWLDVDLDDGLGALPRAAVARWRATAPSSSACSTEREPLYAALADVIVPAERSHRMEPMLAALRAGRRRSTKLLWAATAGSGRDYPVYVGHGLLARAPLLAGDASPAGASSSPTAASAGSTATGSSRSSGRVAIMPGEQSKTIAHAEIVWTELARAGMTRADVVVALGGGVVGDLAGFCAATYQRGVRVRAGADDAGRAGRLRLRRQDRRRPRRGQELRRRLPPALGGDRRHRRRSRRSRRTSSPPATPRWSRRR